ncbi:MAG TPA: YbaB/EbfC family nucleoid-associated protein [Thermoanaerobaculia bacterium]|nr:YbaB/EbfC family nucleoid-associated protein [Thermoanaerobaculia bacterium]
MTNIRQLMKQAEQMQERMRQELAELVVEASVGGGMVTVQMSGHKQIVGVKIDPEVLDPEDPSMVEDLVLAAVNEAGRKVDESLQERLGALAGGGIPGMPDFLR